MISFPESICPLCSQIFVRERLHEHIDSEHPRLRQSTIKVIQAYHPGWHEDHGACGPCWCSFRDAGRILNMIRSAKPEAVGERLDSGRLALERHDNDLDQSADAR